ncbi:MAG: hypothetical protein ACRC68_17750 [Clostridium sp.]
MKHTILNKNLTSATLYTNEHESGIPKIKFNETSNKSITITMVPVAKLTNASLLVPSCVSKGNKDHRKLRIANINSVEGTNKKVFSYSGEHNVVIAKWDEELGGMFNIDSKRNLVVDLVVCEERVVAFTMEFGAAARPVKKTIVFCVHNIVGSGDKFTAKKFDLTNFNEFVIARGKFEQTATGYEAMVKTALANPNGSEADAILKLAEQIMKARGGSGEEVVPVIADTPIEGGSGEEVVPVIADTPIEGGSGEEVVAIEADTPIEGGSNCDAIVEQDWMKQALEERDREDKLKKM